MKRIFMLVIFALLCFVECGQKDEGNNLIIEEEPFFIPKPVLVAEQEVSPLDIGSEAPAFRLPGVDGKYHQLKDFDNASVLVIIFTCNHCPTAQAYEERMIRITEYYKNQSVQLIAISPNSPLGLLYEELGYSDLNDDFDDMITRARDLKYNFPYLYDGDDQQVSLQYGPAATPHAFVFDQDRKLQYRGRIDDSEKPGTADGEDLRNAIESLLNKSTPKTQVTKSFGCSTKWGWKTEYKTKINKEWAAKEVSIEEADEQKIGQILKNEDSQKLRLINIWATWCGPCIIEYPDFIVLQRMYGARDFEFVSISADKPGQQDKALKFLTDKASAVKNYIFSKEDKYALIEAVDPNWNGALPYTVLVEPGGNIIWSEQGPADFLDLKRAIVDHEMIGRYY